jgi:hypothetical protein
MAIHDPVAMIGQDIMKIALGKYAYRKDKQDNPANYLLYDRLFVQQEGRLQWLQK